MTNAAKLSVFSAIINGLFTFMIGNIGGIPFLKKISDTVEVREIEERKRWKFQLVIYEKCACDDCDCSDVLIKR